MREQHWDDDDRRRTGGGLVVATHPMNVRGRNCHCLFCKKSLDTFAQLLAHEQQCDMGIHVRKMWARRLERAKRNYARTGHL